MFTDRIEFWTPERSRLVLRIIAAMQLFAVVLTYINDSQSTRSIRRGDFPSFYSAAVIAASGDYQRLYDFEYQREIQNRFWPSLAGKIAPYAYPPQVALILSPLAKYNAQKAQLIFITFMFCCFLVASILAAKILNLNKLDTICLFLLFAPLTSGIFSSQNTALSLLCYVATLFFISREQKFVAGFFSGLWFFKPHFAGIFLFFLSFTKSLKLLAGAAVSILIYYLLGFYMLGFAWPLIWLRFLKTYASTEIPANTFQLISLNGSFLPLWCSLVISLGIIIFIAKKAANFSEKDLVLLLAPIIVLISPHTIYYDLGLCVVTLASLISLKNDREVSILALALIAILYVSSNRSMFAVSPLILIAPIIIIWFFKSRQMRASNPQLS